MIDYIRAVTSGAVPVCKAIKKLVEKHLREVELSEVEDYPYYFDFSEADRVIQFAKFLKHQKGKLRGKPIILETWQAFVLGLLFGWKRKKDHLRRFRKFYFQIARKNGKTTMAVVIVLYLFYRSEEGEFYSIATKKDQARIAFDIARAMIKDQEDLIKITTVQVHKVIKGACTYVPMSAEDKKADGFNPLVVLVDEYHAHRTDEQLQVYQSGMGSREEPLILITTTAGFNLDGPCREEYDRSKKILDGIFQDDTLLPVIYELDDPKEWDKPEAWIQANPNLGVSISMEYLENQYNEATQKPNKKTDFLTKNLNLWVDSKSVWIEADIWKRNTGSISRDELIGRRCYGGIDLSAISDLTCWSLYFPPLTVGEKVKAIHRAYIPEETISRRAKYEHVQYRRWIQDGFIVPTPGEVVEHKYLVDDLLEAAALYQIVEVGYDPALSASIVAPLEREGFDLVIVPQGIFKFSPFVKDWEKLIRSGGLSDSDPVMAWCVSNAMIRPDVNDNYKPLKGPDRAKRIDLVISSIVAHSRLVANEAAGPKGPSVYEVMMAEEDQEEKTESEGTIEKEEPQPRQRSVFDVLMDME